ncbi:cytochrome c oxidase assembly protein [Paenibacillus lautus]|uniref:cytochrome c oxidase assembly protein n=1 Tax=Paenibacillus lautus TaxID=1401 RepID=UPI003D9A9B00
MSNHSIQHHGADMFEGTAVWQPWEWILTSFLAGLILLYWTAAAISNRRHRIWPAHRYVCWIAGLTCIALSLAGPLARLAPANFPVHMLGHLLLGMLGPLLIAFSAPLTLLLRSIPVPFARRISLLLRSRLVHFIAHPLAATLLNIGGLWTLYTTGLFTAMHQNLILHIAVHFHVFAAGYLFTVSLIYVDVVPHRRSFRIRAFILIFAMAGHGILSKYLYAHPPEGVPSEQAKLGGMLMYYGGDAVDLVLVLWLCMQWYRSSRPRAASFHPISD